MKPTQIREEAIAMFDSGDNRSFDQIYAGKEDLFENVDDLINPKFRKLFEETYQVGNIQQKRLRENEETGSPSTTASKHNFSGDEPGPSGDGIPEGHNKADMGGSDSQTTQSKPGFSTNAKLGHEPPMGDSTKIHEAFANIFEKAKKVKECDVEYGGNLWGNGELNNKNDGVPGGHNSALSKGATSQVTQSGQDYDTNPKLFEAIHKKALKENNGCVSCGKEIENYMTGPLCARCFSEDAVNNHEVEEDECSRCGTIDILDPETGLCQDCAREVF